MHPFTFGDFELSIFSDGTYLADGGAMFGVVPKTLWGKKVHSDELNRITLGLNSLLIRTGRHTVLVETGIGPKLPKKLQGFYQNHPKLLDNLRAGGVDPAQIDIVINTHLHFDHCGWNTMRHGDRVVPTFPNARYFVQKGEVDHGHRQYERDRISYISDNYDPLLANGQMTMLEDDEREIVPGVSVRVYPGHTRRMMAVLLRSGDKTACYISDLIPTLAHLDLTWVMGYDLYPLTSIESRKRFYAEAIPQKWLVIFTHEPRTPCAYLEWDAKGKAIARRK